MPPYFLQDDEEEFEYYLGELPLPTEDNPLPADDRTALLYSRVPYSERQNLFDLYTERGKIDQVGLDMAIIATGLKGWRNLMSRRGPVEFPDPAGKTVLQHRQEVLTIIERLLVNDGYRLAQACQAPAPEELLKNWPAPLNGKTPSPIPLQGRDILVSTAAPNVPSLANESPVMTEA